MHLTGLILFIFSILGLIVWIVSTLSLLGSKETIINRELYGIPLEINIMPLLISLVLIAVSAGMAWG
ncbi:MAG: hypothetical protein COA44_15840 [Arcobacter sp.]|nr:MAG: hypothetical protein COA44_15840 [Arcobacter sp.]